MKIEVRKNSLVFNGKKYRCTIGAGGIKPDKKEGDGSTPAGCFKLRQVFYRADRIKKPETALPVQVINQGDLWCDESSHRAYNTLVKYPHSDSYENLWREDNIYDIVVPIGYNDDPATPGMGSAIFLHIAREDYSPTAGCIALAMPDLLDILKLANSETQICIKPS